MAREFVGTEMTSTCGELEEGVVPYSLMWMRVFNDVAMIKRHVIGSPRLGPRN